MDEDICYKKNYVFQVIFRIDLANPIDELASQMPREIGSKIKENYPIFEPQEIIGREFTINNFGIGNIGNIGTNGVKKWVFYSRNRKNTCAILTNCIMFTYSIYNTFDEIKSVILDIINTIDKKYEKKELSASRIGMRFVNTNLFCF